MDRGDEQGSRKQPLSRDEGGAASPVVTEELIGAFMRLAKGDFSVRLPRNFRRDSDDIIALFVNLIAEELGRLVEDKERERQKLEDGVAELSEKFIRLAAGDFSVRAERDDSGDLLDVLAFMVNNTAAEVGDAFDSAEEQRRIVEAILESMVDGVILVDPSGVVQRANRAFADCLGYEEQSELVGQRLGALLAAKDQLLARRLVSDDSPVRSLDVVFRSASGESVPLTVNASLQHGAGGEAAGVVIVARDERELRDARSQLQLSDRLTTMGTLAAGVAHEINNPLAYIVANLDFVTEELEELRGGSPDPADIDEMKRALEASLGGAQRIRQIVDDLKGLSRVDREAVGKVDLPKLLDSACHMLQNEVRHRARLVKEIAGTPPVEGNEARLLQVFLNLIQNAAHAIPSGDVASNTIRLVTGERDGGAFVEIHDTGGGMPEADLDRIFDAFYTTKPIGVGTGLGLAICHRIVAGMGGHFEVESRLGAGSMFRVVFPPAKDAPAPAKVEPWPAKTRTRRRRVLVIDDETEVLESIRRVLEREHQVTVAAGGREGIAHLGAGEWDLILCDLMMPEVNGPAVYEKILADAPELAERVVFMTGGSFDHEIRAFVARVPNGILEKPFDTLALRALVARLPH